MNEDRGTVEQQPQGAAAVMDAAFEERYVEAD